MKLLNGVDMDKVYTADEVYEMYERGRLKPIAAEGYIPRANADGTCQFVPWQDSDAARHRLGLPMREYVANDQTWDDMRAEVEHEHPIRRRTPEERVVAMLLRMIDQAQQAGTIPGLSDEQIRNITGEAWKSGVTTVTEAMVRQVAAHYLRKAEATNREADSHRVTRAHMTA